MGFYIVFFSGAKGLELVHLRYGSKLSAYISETQLADLKQNLITVKNEYLCYVTSCAVTENRKRVLVENIIEYKKNTV